jgi:branched-chain amino acid transport system ATP-binding protein
MRRFGGRKAVDDLSFKVRRGTVHGLVGPNGAGKTTAFSLIAGLYAPSSGQVLLEGRDVTGLRPAALARGGLIWALHYAPFSEFSVLDNVRLGCCPSAHASFLSGFLGGGCDAAREVDRRAFAILDFFGLGERRDDPASSLPHGLQRALGMAVALALEPKLLLLDEPFTGMNAGEKAQMIGNIRRLCDERRLTIVLADRERMAMSICDVITAMESGRALMEGAPERIRRNPKGVAAYRGRPAHAA